MHVDTAVKEVDEAVATEVGGENEAFREHGEDLPEDSHLRNA
jgi:hypothetical protein